MKYARRAPGMILFEIQQGFVARGAAISWLSQYPKEEEILFPPLTALEVCGTRVEGAVVIVELRPSVKGSDSGLRSGHDDIEEMARQRALLDEQRRMHEEEQEALGKQRKLKEQQFQWAKALGEVRVTAAARKEAGSSLKAAQLSQAFAKDRWRHSYDSETKKIALAALNDATSGVREAMATLKASDFRLQLAADREARAIKARAEAEKQVTSQRWKMSAMYSQAQVEKAASRAHKIIDALRVSRQAEQVEQVAPPQVVVVEPVEMEVPLDTFEQQSVGELIASFRTSIGPQERWVVDMRAEDVAYALKVCGRIILLADPSTSTKPKDKKMMIDGGIFDELSLCIRKYVDFPDVQYQACRAIAAVGKNADSKVQKSAANVFHAFHAAIERVEEPVREAFQSLTRNNKDNTGGAMRAGFSADWLDPDSNVAV